MNEVIRKKILDRLQRVGLPLKPRDLQAAALRGYSADDFWKTLEEMIIRGDVINDGSFISINIEHVPSRKRNRFSELPIS